MCNILFNAIKLAMITFSAAYTHLFLIVYEWCYLKTWSQLDKSNLLKSPHIAHNVPDIVISQAKMRPDVEGARGGYQ